MLTPMKILQSQLKYNRQLNLKTTLS